MSYTITPLLCNAPTEKIFVSSSGTISTSRLTETRVSWSFRRRFISVPCVQQVSVRTTNPCGLGSRFYRPHGFFKLDFVETMCAVAAQSMNSVSALAELVFSSVMMGNAERNSAGLGRSCSCISRLAGPSTLVTIAVVAVFVPKRSILERQQVWSPLKIWGCQMIYFGAVVTVTSSSKCSALGWPPSWSPITILKSVAPDFSS